MKIKISDLWRWETPIDRGPFVIWAFLLFGVKYFLDRWVMFHWFGQDWSFINYFSLASPALAEPATGRPPTASFILLGLSLPFLWAGIVLSLRRLCSLGAPLWLVVLFVVPFAKWVLFFILAILPRRSPPKIEAQEPSQQSRWLDRIIPQSAFGSAAMGVALSSILALACVQFGVGVLQNYGLGLFVGLPFVMGFLTVLIYGYHRPRKFGECIIVASCAPLMASAALLTFAFEGLICLLMAAPLACALALIGGVFGYAIQSIHWQREAAKLFCASLVAAPAFMSAERWGNPPAPMLEVKSSVVISADPDRVWKHVVSFTELAPPTEWLFRAGIAYPIRAEIRGHGPGAMRSCVFSTGPFVEPIEVWDAPRLLKFSVTKNPEPMQEWTPYRRVRPPHLNGFLVSQAGQFRLTPLANGRTQLEGTTWYRHHMWPTGYWQLWSDYIIHRIHLRVLNHVKQLAEGIEE